MWLYGLLSVNPSCSACCKQVPLKNAVGEVEALWTFNSWCTCSYSGCDSRCQDLCFGRTPRGFQSLLVGIPLSHCLFRVLSRLDRNPAIWYGMVWLGTLSQRSRVSVAARQRREKENKSYVLPDATRKKNIRLRAVETNMKHKNYTSYILHSSTTYLRKSTSRAHSVYSHCG